MRDGTELEVKVRLGETELIKEAGSRALGLRVLKDQPRRGDVHVGSVAPPGWSGWRARASSWPRWPSPIPTAALPAREEMAREVPELDLWDDAVLSLDVAEGIRRARAGEAAALALDKRVTNSDGAVFGRTVGASAFATSAGFSGSVRGTHVSFAVEPLCDDADGKKRNGSYWTASRFAARSRDPEGGRASRRRGARSPSWARARSRPARRRWSSRPRRRAGCSASSPA